MHPGLRMGTGEMDNNQYRLGLIYITADRAINEKNKGG